MKTAPQIIFVNRFFHPDHSATSQLVSDLAFTLARGGRRVAVVTSRLRYDDPKARLPRREVVEGVEVLRVTTTGFGRAGLAGRAFDLASFYAAAAGALLGLAGKGSVIVAKTDPPLLSVMAAPIARLTGARVVNWLQDVYPEVASALGLRALSGGLGRALQRLRDASLRNAHLNVVLGERMAGLLEARGAPRDRIHIVPNWSDDQAIAPLDHADNPLREAWGLKDRFVVGYSGNLGRAHEYATLLAAAEILKDDPAIRFLMIGDGHNLAGLKAAATAAGLTNILFQPYQDQAALAASLGVADAHWISLRPEMEGLIVPSKAYGVLAAGRPIIAVTEADGEIARLVRAHRCGVQIPPGDGVAFAEAVRRMASDPAGVRRMGQAARDAAIRVFSRRQALERWTEILDGALAGRANCRRDPEPLSETA
jgi:glycosyltransferase involved in cell wall biosynthesis